MCKTLAAVRDFDIGKSVVSIFNPKTVKYYAID